MPQISQVKLSATHNATLKYFKHLSELKIPFFGQCIDTHLSHLNRNMIQNWLELTSSSWLLRFPVLELLETECKHKRGLYIIENVNCVLTALSHQQHTILSTSDLGQNLEWSGLGGASTGAPVLCVLRYALPASISMTRHMVKMYVSVHNMFPGNSGRIGRVALANILGLVKDISFQDHFIFIDPVMWVVWKSVCQSGW